MFGTSNLPSDPVDLVVKDVDGTLHKVVASKSEADKFVNDTILMLDDERAQIKKAAHDDLDRAFAQAFQDREQAVSSYADWFFEWKRSYVVLKESLTSAVTRFFEAGKYELLTEAIEADVKDYFLRNYKEQVLKPELRDQTITQGVEQAARHAHDSYRRVIANGDMRLQLFLAKHTSHLEDIPAATPMTNVKLDWDAQKWKAPVYLMEDRAFDGVAGIGAAAAGGTVGALALGPALNGVLAQSFGQVSRRFVTSLGTRLAFAEQGAVAGTMVQPMGGQVIGAAIGVAIGVVADYLSNAANEAFNRDEFVAANNQALDATIATWKATLTANIDTAIDKWFDDARVERRAQRRNNRTGHFLSKSMRFRRRALISVANPVCGDMLGQVSVEANGDGRHGQKHCAAGGDQIAARRCPQGSGRGGLSARTTSPTGATARSRGSSC